MDTFHFHPVRKVQDLFLLTVAKQAIELDFHIVAQDSEASALLQTTSALTGLLMAEIRSLLNPEPAQPAVFAFYTCWQAWTTNLV